MPADQLKSHTESAVLSRVSEVPAPLGQVNRAKRRLFAEIYRQTFVFFNEPLSYS